MFIITESTRPGRQIVLRRRSLPYWDVSFGGEQRVAIKYYPGNPVASSQVLGPKFTSTQIKGVWKDAFLYSSPAAEASPLSSMGFQGGGLTSAPILRNFAALGPSSTPSAATPAGGLVTSGGSTFMSGGSIPGSEGLAQRAIVVRDAFELIRLSGALLRVEWKSTVRYGHMVSAVYTYKTEMDIGFEIGFEWTGDSLSKPVIRTKPKLAPVGILQKLFDALRKASDLLNALLAKSPHGALANKLKLLGSYLVELLNGIGRVVGLALVPRELLGTMKQQFVRLKLAAADIRDLARSVPAGYAASKTGSPNDVEDAQDFSALIIAGMRQLGVSSAGIVKQLEELTHDELIGIYTSPGGVTLLDVSTQFYGSPTSWRVIAEYNNLKSATLTRGATLKIPALKRVS